MRLRETTMGEVFKGNGYRTGLFGKWHLGDLYPFRPQDRGFDETVIHGAGGVGQGPDFWGNDYFDDVYLVNGSHKQFEGFCTDVFFEEAISFIGECSKKRQPFLTVVSTNAPHGPFYSPEESYERFRGLEYEGEALSESTGRYYGMIENIDDNVGKLVSFLKEEALFDDTIFVFTSDNGPVTSQGVKLFNASLRGRKGSNYDGGHLAPFIMTWPNGGLKGGRSIESATAHIDILPTLVDICDLKDPGIEFDGRTLRPLLEGDVSRWKPRSFVVESQRVYHPEKYRVFSVVSDNWRLVGKDELYDLRVDRGQADNLADKYPEKVEILTEAYDAFWEDVSRDHHLVSLPLVGFEGANPAFLQSHDWTTEGFWNQIHIRRPFARDFKPVGKWVFNVAEGGWYQISLRRWPAEADQEINAAYVGDAISVDTARLKIQGQEFETKILANAKEVTFRVKLEAGSTELDAVFLSTLGADSISPFYAYVYREIGDAKPGWQTREGLNLPLAKWPEHHGMDPSIAK